MSNPLQPPQQTFVFDSIQISSNFDSGNCSNAQKISSHHYALWIGTDHPKNNYRTWFHFSIQGIPTNSIVKFTLKNMQNQSKLLNQGLVPVWRSEDNMPEYGQLKWERINQKVNLNSIEYTNIGIQWSFQHQFLSPSKHYFAFFYPWSNLDNHHFLNSIEEKISNNSKIYFYRGSIIKSLEGRSIDFLVISSFKGISKKEEPILDEHLFPNNQKKPISFQEKQIIVLSARVHPGQVPGSHVMTGIIKELVSESQTAQELRDNFVFYIFPILNPDGVGRGHYRVDTNGINLNRCYLNPNPKNQPSIYAVKKMIMHAHSQNRFFAFLDLHAHASRKGTFIYGNCSNELMKQMKACLFPKVLSMNSADFQYEGCNFTEKNMYSKDRGDHISKQGAGRVAIFKATKNPNCWTLQCNYNMSRINNILVQKQSGNQTEEDEMSADSLNRQIIMEYWRPTHKQATQFFTIKTFHQLGKQICESFLDLIQKNKNSRIRNKNNHFKNLKNIKMHLSLALLKMAPNRFESQFKKIFYSLKNTENQGIMGNALKALYYKVILEANIVNINNYIKSGDESEIEIKMKKYNNKKMLKNKIRYKQYMQMKTNTEIINKQILSKPKDKNEFEFEMENERSQKFTIELEEVQSRKKNKFQSLNFLPRQINQSCNLNANSSQSEPQKHFHLGTSRNQNQRNQVKSQLNFNIQEKKTNRQAARNDCMEKAEGCVEKVEDCVANGEQNAQRQTKNNSQLSVVRISEFKMISMNKMTTRYQQVKALSKTRGRLNSQNFRISEPHSASKNSMNETSFTRYRQHKQEIIRNLRKQEKPSNFIIDPKNMNAREEYATKGVFVYGGVMNKATKIKEGNKIEILKDKRIGIFSAQTASP